ncbi:MAG: dihydrolipoyllysine-residue succinyltransferase component of 2-oxoglutarate dehydrogenase complex [Chloroflexota bacterium]|nr:MAG: dihydrolipoyllysine-residue succinyltransferase component of 2-oxoglutarate dehydrogenase complex [Chloroflexota bacterium]
MSSEIVVPDLGESIIEATVSRWLKQEGDPVQTGEALVELETDKVNLEVAAEQAGVLRSIKHREGEDVKVGEVLGLIDEAADGAGGQAAAQPAETVAETEKPAPAKAEERATPMAKRLAQERGLDLASVPHDERVMKKDVERYLDEQKGKVETTPAVKATAKVEAGWPASAHDQAGRETRVRMTRRRRTIAQRLVEAQHTAAMLTTFNEIDMSRVMELRQRRQESFQQRHGIKLGFMSFFVKAAVGALKQFPQLNAEIDSEEVVLKHYYDIGMAIGAEEGLVVPVIRAADRLTFAEIEQTISDYVKKSQAGTLSLEELRGGTFSITNGGIFGSLLSTPILNPPQVGILGLHKIEKRPIALNDEVVIRPMMYVALSYDHRIVDGREAVQFLVRVKELIEDPETLLLEG